MPPKSDLWKKAFDRLSDDEKSKLGQVSGSRLEVLVDLDKIVQDKLQACVHKRWKFSNRKGNTVVARDLFEKLARSVKSFADTVDVVALYDPVHVALPWAGIRFLLQIAISDVQTWGMMVEGVERVANLITRYALVEAMFLTSNSPLTPQLATVVSELYALILQYLVRANDYFGRSTPARMVQSGFRLNENTINEMFDKISQKDQEGQAVLRLLEINEHRQSVESIGSKVENLQQLQDDIHNLQIGFSAGVSSFETIHVRAEQQNHAHFDDVQHRLSETCSVLEQPLIRLTAKLDQEEDFLSRETRLGILHWLSRVPYRKHHASMARDLLQGSGGWIERHDAFNEWRNSSSSAVLWLHGIPGSGKSKLVAHVIEVLQEAAHSVPFAAPVAYFYCTRATAEPERADPTTILRSILKQIACPSPNEPISPLVLDIYKSKKSDAETDDSEIEPLTAQECVELIVKVAEQTSLTILLDALDECNPDLRHILLQSFETIVSKSSNLVKLFVSSRDDADIAMRMSATPSIYITATENTADIQRFVDSDVATAIDSKRILHGNVSAILRDKISAALVARAQGMFLSVTLQIEALCDHQAIQLKEDVLEELAKSTKSLNQLWKDAMGRILSMSTISRNVALNTLSWLLIARAVLPSHEFVVAISRRSGRPLECSDLLNVSSNMVVLDVEMNVFRYAHLSVREFLETTDAFAPAKVQPAMALHCLNESAETTSINNSKETSTVDSYLTYVSVNWPIHCQATWSDISPELLFTLRKFLSYSGDSSGPFARWLDRVAGISTAAIEEDFKLLFQSSLSKLRHPIFLVIAWDFLEIFDDVWTPEVNSQNLVNQFNLTALALACNLGRSEMAKLMVDRGAVVDVVATNRGWRSTYGHLLENPLAAAIFHGHLDIISNLMDVGANPSLFNNEAPYFCPLAVAAMVGDTRTLEQFLLKGADPGVGDTYTGASPLLLAVENRHSSACRLLLKAGADPNRYCEETYIRGSQFPLEEACYNGDLVIIEELLEHGADIDSSNAWRGTPLSSAAYKGNQKVVEMLLHKGADPVIPSAPYGNAFLSAVAGGDLDIISMMLQMGVDVNIEVPNGRGNALGIAITYNHADVLRMLLEHGADPAMEFQYGKKRYDAMTFAAANGGMGLIQDLLDFFKRRNQQPDLFEMLLHALASNRPKITRLLLETGVDPRAKDKYGATPLHYAVASCPVTTIQDLLAHDVDLSAQHEIHGSVLQMLCNRETDRIFLTQDEDEDRKIFQLLLDKGATFEVEGGEHDSFLQLAAYQDHPWFIKSALKLGAIPRTGAGLSGGPYHAAASRGHPEALDEHLKSTLDVNISTSPFGTALAAAACHGRSPASLRLQSFRSLAKPERRRHRISFANSIIRIDQPSYAKVAAMLLDAGAKVDVFGGCYGNALQAAAYVGNHEVVKRLLEAGANPNVITGFYGSALQAAAAGESESWFITQWEHSQESVMMHPEEQPDALANELSDKLANEHEVTVDILLKAGADVNAAGGFFGSSLQAAAHSDNISVVEKLLSAGAIVCENGEGFYGGCLSAAVSFGKRQLMDTSYYTVATSSNAEGILSLLLRHVSTTTYEESCKLALHRATQQQNKEGLALLRKFIPLTAVERGIELSLEIADESDQCSN